MTTEQSAEDRRNTMKELYKAGLTYREIGERFGVSRQRVHQIVTKSYYAPPEIISTPSCINWDGRKNRNGYGLWWRKGKLQMAHRVAWQERNGEIPEGMHVLHKCDNPSCINPDHLYLGTNEDNVKDRVRRKRGKHGYRITNKQKVMLEEIANHFGVKPYRAMQLIIEATFSNLGITLQEGQNEHQ